MAHRTATRFNWITGAFLVIAIVVAALIGSDAILGLGLGFALRDVPVAVFIVIVAAFIRYAGLWFYEADWGPRLGR